MGRIRAHWILALPLLLAAGPAYGPELKSGFAAAEQGLWREARFRYDQALKKAEASGAEDYRLYNNLAVTAEALGDFAQARRWYEKAVALKPDDEPLRDNFAAFKAYTRQLPGVWPAGAPASAPAAPPASAPAAAPAPDPGPEKKS